MAESIAIHFRDANWEDLTKVLDTIANKIRPLRWNYPKGDEPEIFAYEYDDLLNEYEREEEISLIYELLNGFPTSTLCIQLRRLRGNSSCDSAAELTTLLLEQFPGIVDDLYGEPGFWTLEEIKMGVIKDYGKFLDIYRTS